jgi:hypothetical protein
LAPYYSINFGMMMSAKGARECLGFILFVPSFRFYFPPIGEFSDIFLLFGFGFTAADGMVVSAHSIL